MVRIILGGRITPEKKKEVKKSSENAGREDSEFDESVYRSIYDGVSIGIQICRLLYDKDGKPDDFVFLAVNPAYEAQTGFGGGDVVGKRVTEFMPFVEPVWFELAGEAIRSRKAQSCEEYSQPLDRWFRASAAPLPGKDLFSFVFEDITGRKKSEEALKKSEQLYHTLFDNAEDGFQLIEILYDEAGNPYDYLIVKVNKVWEQQTGCRASDFEGKRISESIPNVEPVRISNYTGVAITGESKRFEEFNALSNRWYDVYAFPYAEDQVGILFKDITERKKTEEELKRSNEELRQFTYVASHDLQEPLRMVISYLGLLEQRYQGKVLDEKAMEFMSFATQGAERMRELIQDLLEYSRVDTRGKQFEPTNINEVVNRALLALKPQIDESHAKIEVGELPMAWVDDKQMIQLFQNLIGNAIKFRGKEAPIIEISCASRMNNWRFRVEDNGMGIAPEHFRRIFEVFTKLHTHDEYAGTGVGLAIVKKIVERHGGRIWVESEGEGKGCTFNFTIPKAIR